MSGGAPESWDQDVNNQLSKLNVNATEFVPSWLPPPQNTPETSKKMFHKVFNN